MDHLLHRLLSRSAEDHPDRAAVEDGDLSLTYAQLEARANQVARLLKGLGVARGDRVGLYLDKSLEAVTAIYGVMKAGAVYVPLDPRAPVPRLAYIAADCGLNLLVSGTEKSGAWADLVANGAPIEAIVVPNAERVDSDTAGRSS